MITVQTLVADTLTPVGAYAALRHAAGAEASFLFESVVGGKRWARYSILGYRPQYEATLTRSGWQVTGPRASVLADSLVRHADPLVAGARLFGAADQRVHGNPAEKFARSLVGFFAWDLVHTIDKIPDFTEKHTATSAFPLARFIGGSTIIVFDNLAQTVTVASEDASEVTRAVGIVQTVAALRTLNLPDRARIPANVEVDIGDDQFQTMVRRAQEYIAAGDAFQIVLARTFSVPQGARDPFDVYRAMRVINPSPYMYFLDFPPAAGESSRTQILGASPETLVRLEDGIMTLRPIAGTRPRGRTHEEDQALEEELLADPKERAEHVMLIDLGRNDVGRVANIGSVKLTRRMEIERYSHVMHLVSEVEGRVPSELSPLEIVRASFPAGTLSGAPKVRAMQIIRELEARPRGLYGGAVGYLARTGDLDLAIAIRTAVCRNGVFEVTAGAGIVEASIPSMEAEETRNKARAVLCAVESAG